MLEEREVEKLKSRLKEAFSGYEELAGGKNFRYHHLISVHKYVKKIAEKEQLEGQVEMRVLEVAALLHDIGRKQDIKDDYLDPIEQHQGHAEAGAESVKEFVEDILKAGEVSKLRKIIRNHHSEPETLEGKVLQDADHLFKYGVHDSWRMFHYGYEKEREIVTAPEYAENSLLPELESNLSEFFFESARKTAEKRLEKYRSFIDNFRSEMKGEDIQEN